MTDCAIVREMIPDLVADRLDPSLAADVEAHASGCAECAEEREIALALFGGRARVPDGLAASVVAAVRRDRRSANRSWWGLSAAAVAALAIGIGISSDPAIVVPVAPEFATELEEGDLWSSDDGLLAGAPALHDLSDEALEELLDQLALGGAGGSV